MVAGSVNPDTACGARPFSDKQLVAALANTLDFFLGRKTRVAVIEYLGVREDPLQNVYRPNDFENAHQLEKPVNQLTKDQLEKKLSMLFGASGAVTVLTHIDRELRAC